MYSADCGLCRLTLEIILHFVLYRYCTCDCSQMNQGLLLHGAVNISKTCDSFQMYSYEADVHVSPQVLEVVYYQRQSWHVRLSNRLTSLV